MDASILLTENLNWVFNFKEKYSTDVIGFYSDFLTTNREYPILENWFLAAPKNNSFINNWLQLYKECYTSDNPFTFFKELINNSTKIQGIDKNLSQYLICYLAAMQIMLENKDYKILMLSANETAHYYNFNLKLKPHQLCKVFLFDKAEQIYPKLIKFEKRGRVAIDTAIEQGQYSKKSLLFRLSPDDRYYSNKFPRYVNYVMFIISNFKKKYLKND